MPGGIHGLELMLEITILYKTPRYVLQGFNFPDDRGHFSIDFGVAREVCISDAQVEIQSRPNVHLWFTPDDGPQMDVCPVYAFHGGLINLHNAEAEAEEWLSTLPLDL